MSISTLIPKAQVLSLDKERKLVYDFNALAKLEEHLGSLAEALDKLAAGSIHANMVMLWAGLLRDDPGLTLDEVSTWKPAIVFECAEAIYAALNEAMPVGKPPAEPKPKGK